MASRADYVKLHFIVFLWGFSAILGKLVTIPAMEMVFYRSILAAAGMGTVIFFSSHATFAVTRPQAIRLLAIGSIVALHWISFFEAARVSNVSISLVGFATNSLWAAWLEPFFNRSKIKKFELALGLLVIAGLLVIFSFDFHYKVGLLLGVVAGFTSALFSVFNARMVQRLEAFTITFYEMIGAFITMGLVLLLVQLFNANDKPLQLIPTAMDWLYIGLLAGVCSVYAYSVAVNLMKKISVFMLQLTLNLEPLYGIVMAVIIFGETEKMGTSFYVGTLMILSAVLAYPGLRGRYDRKV